MAKHTRHVEGYNGTLDDLAKAVGNMTYDQTAAFIRKLADDIKHQADSDMKRGRKKLAEESYNAAERLYEARDNMQAAWKICEPYMKKE